MSGTTNLPKKIVMDIVFEGMSLNYDQRVGNIQELKKINMPDGSIRTLVSRYALRYSILEQMDGFAKGDVLNNEGDVIQVKLDALISGKLFEFPEFVLFGFLITDPQIQRENPVKISHAISLTPYRNDILFYANHSFAKRVREFKGEESLKPNPFNKEEHHAWYVYNITIDVDNMKKYEFYLSEKKLKELKYVNYKEEKGKILIDIKKDGEIIGKIEIGDVKEPKNNKMKKVEVLLYEKYVCKILKDFVKAVFHLKRSIQGKEEDLSPKFAIIQCIRENEPYNTYMRNIFFSPEWREEVTIEEKKDEDGKKKITTYVKRVIGGEVEIVGLNKPLIIERNIGNIIGKICAEGERCKDEKILYIPKGFNVDEGKGIAEIGSITLKWK